MPNYYFVGNSVLLLKKYWVTIDDSNYISFVHFEWLSNYYPKGFDILKIWLPYIKGGSGSDVFTKRLAKGLESHGHRVEVSSYPRFWQYCPWPLRFVPSPVNTDIILTNSWNGFAFKRKNTKLIVVAHHLVYDSIYKNHKSFAQAVFHEIFVKSYERASFNHSDKIIAVSNYTKDKIHEIFKRSDINVVHNGIDFALFMPSNKKPLSLKRKIRLLFVGNLSKRKGSDLLPGIMEKLGKNYELSYTIGLRTKDPFANISSMRSLGRLSQKGIIRAYQDADILLFPTRLEGFGLTAIEAMSCGTPVVASDCSSLPEIIENGKTGILCPANNVDAFANAIKELVAKPERLIDMGIKARNSVKKKFGLEKMIAEYISLFKTL